MNTPPQRRNRADRAPVQEPEYRKLCARTPTRCSPHARLTPSGMRRAARRLLRRARSHRRPSDLAHALPDGRSSRGSPITSPVRYYLDPMQSAHGQIVRRLRHLPHADVAEGVDRRQRVFDGMKASGGASATASPMCS